MAGAASQKMVAAKLGTSRFLTSLYPRYDVNRDVVGARTRLILVLFPFLCSSNLTFSLAPGWLFVETEDWRPDLEGRWMDPVGTDDSTY